MTCAWANNTGAGFDEEELGIKLSDKLEAMCPCYAQMEQVFGQKANVKSFKQVDTTSDAKNKNGSGSEVPSQGEIREESNSGFSAYEQRQRAVQKVQEANKANRGVCGEGNHGNNENESPSGTSSNGNRQNVSKRSFFSL
ncbi:hypothetical protein O181_014175 [Austropuccinia psidii MF-1]|uniref:Uncharacterized protein n=1 Tax=Austropuccinia psidii MF-1 TaxID=1389203 RepID=A0A9Q3GPN6_9BASI|nr:hypothetical protein [Austropuccinia psidii MF-1]